jgi:hypothetical protein
MELNTEIAARLAYLEKSCSSLQTNSVFQPRRGGLLVVIFKKLVQTSFVGTC